MLALALGLSPLAELETSFGLRFLYALRGPVAAPQDIVIVAMDAASAQALGVPERPERWPRDLHARLIEGLATGGARVIGFDLLFAQAREPAGDAALADAMRRAGNVVLAETIRRDSIRGADGRVVASVDHSVPPLPLFAEAAGASAPFVLPKTPDGVFEFWTQVPTLGDRPSLPVVLAEHIGAARLPAGPSPDEPRRVLNLYGPLGTVTTIPYQRALELIVDRAAAVATFGGKAVLVGYSEANQSRQIDAYRTPFSTADGVDVSGVELAATALGNLLEGSWLRRPGEGATALLLAAQGALLALPWGFARPRAALAATVGVCAVYATVTLLAFSAARWWLPVVLPLVFLPALVAAMGIALQHREALRRRVELERALEMGVPRAAIERLAAVLGEGGHGKTVYAVCLCSDIVSYTTIAEALSPEAARDLLNRYLGRFIPVVEAHGGYAADMVGDSVMSLWIAEAAPEAAVAAACGAAHALDRAMNASSGEDGALPTRLGLHCGRIFFGEVGTAGRYELRAVGDIVNTASRIQGANKYLHTGVLVSRAVAEWLGKGEARSLGRFALAGKGQAMELLELPREPLPEGAAERFGAGLQAFEAGDFGAAAKHFAGAREAGDAGPAAFYLAQCRALAARPRDPDWQGVAVLPGK